MVAAFKSCDLWCVSAISEMQKVSVLPDFCRFLFLVFQPVELPESWQEQFDS